MNQPRRKPQSKNRRRSSGGARPGELWRVAPEPPAPAPIRPTDDPTALLRSLGDPPLQGQGTVALHYLGAVVERAVGIATALAVAGGLLADETADGDG